MIIKTRNPAETIRPHKYLYGELFAIDTAIRRNSQRGKRRKNLVCTDSLSCLKYLKVAHEQAPTMARDIVQNKND